MVLNNVGKENSVIVDAKLITNFNFCQVTAGPQLAMIYANLCKRMDSIKVEMTSEGSELSKDDTLQVPKKV